MKLGPGLDLIETVTLHGIVDVYKMNGMRVARKWPTKPKQPRTPAQEAHWAKIRAANNWFHTLPGWWKSAWKNCNTPKGYSWYDLCMSSWWALWDWWPQPIAESGPTFGGWWDWTDPTHTKKQCGIKFSPAATWYTEMYYPTWTTIPGTNYIPLNWFQTGWKCYRGKKRKPIWKWDSTGYSSFKSGVVLWDTWWFTLYAGEPQPIQLLLTQDFGPHSVDEPIPCSGRFLITEYTQREWP